MIVELTRQYGWFVTGSTWTASTLWGLLHLIEAETRLAFADIDWSGDANRIVDPLADLHPYPARFIELIPDALLSRYAHPGARILDPFCGSGTTLARAVRAGYAVTGVDLHPIACLISRVKTRSYSLQDFKTLETASSAPIVATETPPVHVASIPRLDHWFDRDVQEALTNIVASIRTYRDSRISDVLSCAVSRMIVRVSRQESDTRYAAITKNVSYESTVSLYRRSVKDICAALRSAGLPNTIDATIVQADIGATTAEQLGGPFDLVITSPPYPNAYEYWLYHKYRMYWLGFDPIAVRTKEIGARPHYFRKHPQTAADFERQMSSLIGLLAAVTTLVAPLCFVISDSIIHGTPIDNRALMTRAASNHGYRLSDSTIRRIPAHRKAFNPVVSPRNEEHVLVFERQ